MALYSPALVSLVSVLSMFAVKLLFREMLRGVATQSPPVTCAEIQGKWQNHLTLDWPSLFSSLFARSSSCSTFFSSLTTNIARYCLRTTQ